MMMVIYVIVYRMSEEANSKRTTVRAAGETQLCTEGVSRSQVRM